MLRMLGPHQGIRLERLRAELDDRFENSEPENIGVNQTSIVEQEAKELPPIEAKSQFNLHHLKIHLQHQQTMKAMNG